MMKLFRRYRVEGWKPDSRFVVRGPDRSSQSSVFRDLHKMREEVPERMICFIRILHGDEVIYEEEA